MRLNEICDVTLIDNREMTLLFHIDNILCNDTFSKYERADINFVQLGNLAEEVH